MGSSPPWRASGGNIRPGTPRRICGGAAEGNPPVDRYLAPDEEAHLVGRPRHRLAVRVVGEADEIAVETGLDLGEEGAGGGGGHRAGRVRTQLFLVQRDAAEKDRLSV